MDIPLADGNERVDLLHPVLQARLVAFAHDQRLRNQIAIESAARTREEQMYLYQGYVAGKPGFNLAADPNRNITPAYGLTSARGSWHMVQPDGYAYAVDLDMDRFSADVLAIMPAVAAEYRLVQTVLHPGFSNPHSPPPPLPANRPDTRAVKEAWHLQCPLDEGPLVWTPEEAMTPDQERKLDDLIENVGTLLTRTDLLLDHVEGREPKAPGASSKRPRALRSVLGDIADKVGVKR